MDPIRCVMLISAAGRVRKAESPEATPAKALFLNLPGKLKRSQSATCGKKEGIPAQLECLSSRMRVTSFFVLWMEVGIGRYRYP